METMSKNKVTIDGVLIIKKKWNCYYPQNKIKNEKVEITEESCKQRIRKFYS